MSNRKVEPAVEPGTQGARGRPLVPPRPPTSRKKPPRPPPVLMRAAFRIHSSTVRLFPSPWLVSAEAPLTSVIGGKGASPRIILRTLHSLSRRLRPQGQIAHRVLHLHDCGPFWQSPIPRHRLTRFPESHFWRLTLDGHFHGLNPSS